MVCLLHWNQTRQFYLYGREASAHSSEVILCAKVGMCKVFRRCLWEAGRIPQGNRGCDPLNKGWEAEISLAIPWLRNKSRTALEDKSLRPLSDWGFLECSTPLKIILAFSCPTICESLCSIENTLVELSLYSPGYFRLPCRSNILKYLWS